MFETDGASVTLSHSRVDNAFELKVPTEQGLLGRVPSLNYFFKVAILTCVKFNLWSSNREKRQWSEARGIPPN